MSSNEQVRCWRWRGINAQGDLCKGLLLARDSQDLETQLRACHIFVQRQHRLWCVPPLSASQLTAWLQQLTHLLRAGLPIDTVMALLQTQSHNAAHYRFTANISTLLKEGRPLSYALSCISPTRKEIALVALTQAGEANGTLVDVLSRLVTQRQREAAWRLEWRKRASYPLVLLLSGTAITFMLLIHIVPSFAQLYAQQQRALPPLTQALLILSQYAHVLGVSALGAVLSAGVLLGQRHRKSVRQTLYRLPIVGPLSRDGIACELLQLVSLGHTSHIALDQFIDRLLGHYHRRPHMHDTLTTLLHQLRIGRSLSGALQQCHAGKHPVVGQEQQHLIVLGEQSGQLPVMLDHAIQMLERARNQRLTRIGTWLEPALMTLLALGIGTVMLGMYLPIFDMGDMAW